MPIRQQTTISVLRTSRQIYGESMVVLYQETSFDLIRSCLFHKRAEKDGKIEQTPHLLLSRIVKLRVITSLTGFPCGCPSSSLGGGSCESYQSPMHFLATLKSLRQLAVSVVHVRIGSAKWRTDFVLARSAVLVENIVAHLAPTVQLRWHDSEHLEQALNRYNWIPAELLKAQEAKFVEQRGSLISTSFETT